MSSNLASLRSPAAPPAVVARSRATHVTPAHAARRHARLELRRLKRHFARVLEVLAARDVSALPAPQRAARAGHLAELRRYALRGRFPKNPLFALPTPFFVDAEGTRCAMAHLIEATGAVSFVSRIAERRNHAFIHELADDPALVAWLDREGLTVDEAAMIQPSYCSDFATECLCREFTPSVLEVLVETIDAEGAIVGQVTAVHGTPIAEVGDTVMLDAFAVEGIAAGDTVLSDESIVFYALTSDGTSLDTSSCETSMFGPPPATAPKDAAIANLLGATCGEGLPSEWTMARGDCSGSTTTTTGGGEGGAGAGGEGEGGEGGGDTIDEGGCSISAPQPSFDAGFGAALLGAAVVAGVVQRARRRLTPRR
jgi:hypothetical protein